MAIVLVLVGPSAIGKSFTANTLIGMFPNHFTRVKVHTTRQPRMSEAKASDRVFLDTEDFEQMAQRGDFSIDEYFSGNQYGIRKDDLKPADRHLIVDAPPRWLPQLLSHDDMLVIGLQTPPDYWPLLEARMKARGDTLSARNARKLQIEADMRDLERLSPSINKYGRIFQVKDDQTVPGTVIPWIMDSLNLRVNRLRTS